MQNDRMNNQPRRRPQYRSMDGFAAPRLNQRRPIASSNQSPLINRVNQIPSIPTTVNAMQIGRQPYRPAAQQPKKAAISRRSLASRLRHPFQRVGPKKKLTKKRLVIRSALITLALLLGVGGFLGIKALHTLDKVFHGNIFSDVTAAFNSTPLKGESTGRVNILLAGDSADQPGHGGADLTDSILLLSIDTKNHTAFLLSIPRDLWVYVPGLSSYQKINAANDVSSFSQSGYPSGGMGQLQEIVQTDLGIPVDYYGVMDYGAFQDAVNAVGGVTIDIKSPDPRGLYDPNTDLNLSNGWVTLNGQQALNLARARGDGYGSYGFPDSDFDRTEHQRQLFVAVASKAKSIGVITNPVKISNLISTLGNNFQTNLSLQNVLRLVQITKGVNLSSIQSYSYCSTLTVGQDGCTNPVLTDYTDPASGEEALAPVSGIGEYGQMQQYYKQLTSSNPVVKEGASVVILNASDVNGLAKNQETLLEAKGVDVSTIGDANNEYPGTMIIDQSKGKDPATKKLLEQLYPGTVVTNNTSPTEATEAQGYTANFVVVLGQNWDTTTSTAQ